MTTYSFLDVQCTITGPGGTLALADGAVAKEGITIVQNDDDTTMTLGAIGGMHSLHASRGGRITVRLLKTNPLNAQLMAMRNYQKTASANAGRNTISLTNPAWGDDYDCRQVAFVKPPDNSYADDGNTLEWAFNAIYIDPQLGSGGLTV